MIAWRRILCPIDFSPHSERALRHALAIARWYDSALTVLHVEDVILGAARAELHLQAQFADWAHRDLREFVEGAGGDRQNVSVHMTSGDAVRAILGHATRESSDLIVMGTRGRSGLARAILGSVTEGVVRESLCPVMTIPPAAPKQVRDEFEPFDSILCASDFSASCRQALDLAIAAGREADARLILLHALELPPGDGGLMPVLGPNQVSMDFSQFRKDALARLERGLPSDAVFRCRPESVVVEGLPADAILRTAENEQIKLIVLGVQTRGTLDRLLFGSTTRRVMQAAACPVLSTRADHNAEPWPAWPPVTDYEVSATRA